MASQLDEPVGQTVGSSDGACAQQPFEFCFASCRLPGCDGWSGEIPEALEESSQSFLEWPNLHVFEVDASHSLVWRQVSTSTRLSFVTTGASAMFGLE